MSDLHLYLQKKQQYLGTYFPQEQLSNNYWQTLEVKLTSKVPGLPDFTPIPRQGS